MFSRFIYIISANENDIILYDSIKKSTEEILLECSSVFSYATPNQIVDEIPFVDVFELDKLVKQYMYHYGIDKVRGGSYYEETLPSEKMCIVETEFKTIDRIYQRNGDNEPSNMDIQQLHKMVLQKYKSSPVYETYFNVSKCMDEIFEVIDANHDENKHTSIDVNNAEWQKYKETKKLYDYIKNFTINGVEKEVRTHVLQDIQELKDILLYGEQCDVVSKEMKRKYATTIATLKHVTKSFFMITESDEITYTPTVHLQNPEFVLDHLFFHRHRVSDWNDYVSNCHILVDYFEFMATKWLNKIAELEYDLTTHPKYADAYYRVNKEVFVQMNR